MPSVRGCPYDTMPARSFWSRSVAKLAPEAINPMVGPPFRISTETKVATAGSCFAQHISRHLQRRGFNYFVTEDCPSFIPNEIANRYGYRVFSARFGNIYTVRQLLQLARRAVGSFEPVEYAWRERGGVVDPFRPFVQPHGFRDVDELKNDRQQHFAAVRALLTESEVFVFTLGLTEAWIDVRDDAVLPVCPGCSTGKYDRDLYKFKNFEYDEIVQDGLEFIDLARSLNPNLNIIFTVSPVPLIATASDEHVLVATTYSKSVLRAAAGKLASSRSSVVYFPSYEIVAGPQSRGAYFESDLRSVKEAGVNHVMQVFFKSFVDDHATVTELSEGGNAPADEAYAKQMQVICDEEVLDNMRLAQS